MASRVPVTFLPAAVTVWVEAGATVLEAAGAAGAIVPAPCGGRGVCGRCAVKVEAGKLAPPDEIEVRGLALSPPGYRLACRARIAGPVSIRPLVVAGTASAVGVGGIDGSYVAAVDLGTTTVGAAVMSAARGVEIGRAVVPNAQQTFGADVLSRVGAATSGRGDALREAAEGSVIAALESACVSAGACLDRVDRVVIAANTVMAALLAGADVSGLGSVPVRVPGGIEGTLRSERIASVLAPGADVRLVPPLGAFVGGDVTAGLVATGVIGSDDDVIYLDVGTNAEIVVRHGGRVTFASAAAGPAFEGYGISCGGPAVEGAVESVAIAEDIELRVIGDGEARWLSGSGLVSAVAGLLRVGHLDSEGVLSAEGPLRDRVDADDRGVLRVGLGPSGGAPYLTQLDVRAFQTAKAAVAAGLVIATRRAGMDVAEVGRLVITGSFGIALQVPDLVSTGGLPEDVADSAELIADAALAGAAVIAFDPRSGDDVDALRRSSVHVELANDQDFSALFVEATALRPYTLSGGY